MAQIRNRSTKNITIKDVAKAAGVSTQTVSRVINNRPDVAPATRERVLKVISELGYAPNIIAKSLSSGRSNTLGVIGFGLEYFGSTSVLRGIEQKANEIGYSVILSLLDDYELSNIDLVLMKLFSRQVEGVIWSIPGLGRPVDGLAGKFDTMRIPVVFLNNEKTNGFRVVALNNRIGGRLATDHLLEQGYRRIGIITGPGGWWETVQRETGWRESLLDAGITDLDNLVVIGDWTAASGETGLHQLLEQAPDLDAVFVSNDQMALGAMKTARELNLKVPQDLGIVGFDDIPESPYFFPSLTTVRQDASRLGALAVEKLYDQIRKGRKHEETSMKTTWVEPRLIIRESSIKSGEAE